MNNKDQYMRFVRGLYAISTVAVTVVIFALFWMFDLNNLMRLSFKGTGNFLIIFAYFILVLAFIYSMDMY